MQEILRLTEEEGNPAGKLERHARLFALACLLVKHFSQPLAEAVEYMGLNKEYFCRLFKKNMGVSYLQYVYQIRTTAVCRELETTDDPIGEIAERHGFRDPKMLNQYFREIYGCTPSEKRKFFREVTLDDADSDSEEADEE